jgi:hypothetical protein
MTRDRIAIGEEAGKTRAFAWALDWPGWCRGTRDRLDLPAALAGAASRYARVAALAGLGFVDDPAGLSAADFELVATVPGSASTDFGVPGTVAEDDRRPLIAGEAERLARLVGAAWMVFDQVVAGAPAELRKGPRGGGRDRAGIVAHCVSSDSAYAAQIGLKIKEPAPLDRSAVEAEREAILAVLSRPSDGSPLGGRRWPARYAARRIAWHALDHAWEIEDKS